MARNTRTLLASCGARSSSAQTAHHRGVDIKKTLVQTNFAGFVPYRCIFAGFIILFSRLTLYKRKLHIQIFVIFLSAHTCIDICLFIKSNIHVKNSSPCSFCYFVGCLFTQPNSTKFFGKISAAVFRTNLTTLPFTTCCITPRVDVIYSGFMLVAKAGSSMYTARHTYSSWVLIEVICL